MSWMKPHHNLHFWSRKGESFPELWAWEIWRRIFCSSTCPGRRWPYGDQGYSSDLYKKQFDRTLEFIDFTSSCELKIPQTNSMIDFTKPTIKSTDRGVGFGISTPCKTSMAGDNRHSSELSSHDPSCFLCPNNTRSNGEKQIRSTNIHLFSRMTIHRFYLTFPEIHLLIMNFCTPHRNVVFAKSSVTRQNIIWPWHN